MNFQSTQRICQIELDDKSIIRRNDDIEHERRIAIFDLLETNRFAPKSDIGGGYPGPYNIKLRMEDNRLAIDLKTKDEKDLETLILPLTPLRKVIKEYFIVCDNYYDAVKSSSPKTIEAIDAGRRALHNEGSEIMRERLADKVDIDFETARRLFTLICVLQIR
jgi:uncharacterized protein (UPF0262 family)